MRKRSIIVNRCYDYTIMVICSIMMLMPIVCCLIAAFKSKTEFYDSKPLDMPISWSYLENFRYVLVEGNMLKALLLSICIVLVSVIISILFCAIMAYYLNRINTKGSSIIYFSLLLLSVIPSIAIQVGAYKIMLSLGLVNSFWGYIIIISESDIVTMFLLRNYFNNTPKAIDDAAMIDGCSSLTIFTTIHLPLMKATLITAALLKSIYIYNEYYMASLYLQSRATNPTVTTVLYSYVGPHGSQYNFICAGVIIIMIPIALVFIIAQKWIISGLMDGCVKY